MYTRDDVETYLAGVWEESYWTDPPTKRGGKTVDPACYRQMKDLSDAQRKRACDPATRKGTIDPKTANGAWAELIDVKDAWLKTPLTIKERRALFLAYGLPPRQRWTQEEIAYNQNVTQRAISYRIENAVQKMLARLNDGIWSELEGVEA